MFVRNAWYIAATRDEITDKPFARTVMNEPIVFLRNGRGEICALEDRCCHRGAPLSLGEATEAGIRCGYHGMEFAPDGRCILIPGADQHSQEGQGQVLSDCLEGRLPLDLDG
jgi:phenylpropionate dioxygenase-like ring-hydroxylating dioxygenase large terminal subunit